MTATDASRHFRYDIQGLRALAVILVILDHAFGFPSGGFVGVDVFYAISGYLITSHLLREVEATGTVSILGFYLKRIRRILPVAIVVAVVTIVLAILLWFPPRAGQVVLDGLSAMAFVANFHFMALGTDYLQQDAAVSPFQHYWSLSIEEQFYAIWPLLLLLLALFVRSKRSRFGIVALVALLSFAWGFYRSVDNPTSAYFDPTVRAWELLLGALLAMAGRRLDFGQKSAELRVALAALGIVLIVGSAMLVSSDWITPVPAVVPAVVGAVVVIMANAPTGPRSILGNPVSRFLGDISYSLYLWHFPVLIFARAELGNSFVVALGTLPIMLLLSWLSYIYVERAVLESSFLRPRQQLSLTTSKLPREMLLGGSVLAALAFIAAVQLYGPYPVRAAQPWLDKFGPESDLNTAAAAQSEAERSAAVASALSAHEWPAEVEAQLQWLSEGDFADAMTDCRHNVFSDAANTCRYRYGSMRAALIGDSVAASWAPTLEAVAREKGWDLVVLAYGNCSLIDVDVTNRAETPGFIAKCRQRRNEMFALLDELKPQILFLSSSESALTYTGLPLDQATMEWSDGAKRTFAKLPAVDQVIVLEDPPWGANPVECATRFTSPSSCVVPVSERHNLKSMAEASAAEAFPNVSYVVTRPWFCKDELCPLFADGAVTRVDQAHLTKGTATMLSALLVEKLGSGVRPADRSHSQP